jgi:hypothetical protein
MALQETIVDIVAPPSDVPRGWDAADAEAEGWTGEQTSQWITTNVVVDDIIDSTGFEQETSEPRTGFEVICIADLLSQTFSIQWLIKNILTQNCLACIFGAPGELKSFFSLALGLSLATVKKFLNSFDVLAPGPVFYIAGEGFHGIAARVRAWIHANDITSLEDIPFFVSKSAASFLDKESAEAVLDAVEQLSQQHGSPVLIIVDTVSRNFGPGNENDTSDMAGFVTVMDQLKSYFNCAVLLIHHSGLSDKDRARGSSVLRAALDFEYKIQRIPGSDIRTISCTKAKDCEPLKPFSVVPCPVPLGLTDPETGDEQTSIILEMTDTPQGAGRAKLTGARRIALEVLQAIYSSKTTPIHIDEWRTKAFDAGISASSDPSSKQKAFKRAVSGLLDMQLIECKGDYYEPL